MEQNLCEQYLKLHTKFDWFIQRYFGCDKVTNLINLAEKGQAKELRTELEGIWFVLPDHIFNIIENPEGWTEFLSLIDD
jgi:hypothetical protein